MGTAKFSDRNLSRRNFREAGKRHRGRKNRGLLFCHSTFGVGCLAPAGEDWWLRARAGVFSASKLEPIAVRTTGCGNGDGVQRRSRQDAAQECSRKTVCQIRRAFDGEIFAGGAAPNIPALTLVVRAPHPDRQGVIKGSAAIGEFGFQTVGHQGVTQAVSPIAGTPLPQWIHWLNPTIAAVLNGGVNFQNFSSSATHRRKL
jgi:hypothetical protein